MQSTNTTGTGTTCALYARVSTNNHGQNPEVQLAELRSYAQRRGWQVANEYVDSGCSGAKASRPALNKLMQDAHQRRFSVVLVWKFDRFARSTQHLLQALETFAALGVAFTSYTEAFDTATPTGKLVLAVLGAVAEMERTLICERIGAGLRHARKRGVKLGRPRNSVRMALLRQYRSDGLSWPRCSELLHQPATTLRRALARELSTSNPVVHATPALQ